MLSLLSDEKNIITLLLSEWFMHSLSCKKLNQLEEEHCQQVEGDHPRPLISPGETHLESCVRFWAPQDKRDGAPEAGPAEGDKDDEGIGAALLQKKAEGAGPVQL